MEGTMELVFARSGIEDGERIYQLNKQLILDYERMECIDLQKVLLWVRKKLADRIHEYITIYFDGEKAGYYHFFRNEEGEYELDDLYIYPGFQNRGIGTEVIKRCCASVKEPVMLYVFIRNQRAVSLYQKLGFEVVQTIKDSRYIMKRYP